MMASGGGDFQGALGLFLPLDVAQIAPNGIAPVNRINRSPPSSGSCPKTVFAMSGTVTKAMISAAPTKSCEIIGAANRRVKNRDFATMGWAARLSTKMSSPITATPTAIMAKGATLLPANKLR